MNDRLDQLDLLARRAADDLDHATEVDTAGGLTGLYAAQARNRSRTWMAAAAVLLMALSAGWFGRGILTHDQVAPADRTPAPAPAPQAATPTLCQRPDVTCLGGRTYRFWLDSPVRWHIPAGFGVDSGAGVSASQVESRWNHRGHAAGVTVLETVGQAAKDGGPLGSAKELTPRAFARWLAAQPFVSATTPERTTLGGRPGWRVRARLAPGATGGDLAVSDGGNAAGLWDGMVADYTFVTVPGSRTGLVWSWALGHDTAALDRNHGLEDGISWPAG